MRVESKTSWIAMAVTLKESRNHGTASGARVDRILQGPVDLGSYL